MSIEENSINPNVANANSNIIQIDSKEKFGATEFRFRFRHLLTDNDIESMCQPGHPLYETLLAKGVHPDNIDLYFHNMKFWGNDDGTVSASILYDPNENETDNKLHQN